MGEDAAAHLCHFLTEPTHQRPTVSPDNPDLAEQFLTLPADRLGLGPTLTLPSADMHLSPVGMLIGKVRLGGEHQATLGVNAQVELPSVKRGLLEAEWLGLDLPLADDRVAVSPFLADGKTHEPATAVRRLTRELLNLGPLGSVFRNRARYRESRKGTSMPPEKHEMIGLAETLQPVFGHLRRQEEALQAAMAPVRELFRRLVTGEG
jgi:hypothetical protein